MTALIQISVEQADALVMIAIEGVHSFAHVLESFPDDDDAERAPADGQRAIEAVTPLLPFASERMRDGFVDAANRFKDAVAELEPVE